MFEKLWRRWRYGDEIVVVTGLPRSGTSMMMKMLEAGGLAVMTDQVRSADDDNPEGYFELERVKDLDKGGDHIWLRQARGQVIKVISHLLRYLPEQNFYRVIFMRRDLDEILASQNRMLVNRGEENPLEDARAKEAYKKHIIETKVFLRTHDCFRLLEVRYRDAIEDPAAVASQVREFLEGRVEAEAMAAAVDAALYRNRRESLGASSA